MTSQKNASDSEVRPRQDTAPAGSHKETTPGERNAPGRPAGKGSEARTGPVKDRNPSSNDRSPKAGQDRPNKGKDAQASGGKSRSRGK